MGLQRNTVAKIHAAMANKVGFKAGNVRGEDFGSWDRVPTGHLPREFETFAAEFCKDAPVYVVFSYNTPIAFYAYARGGWSMPGVKYSVTTTQHQNVVQRAI